MHQSCGADTGQEEGGGREERGVQRREGEEQEGTAAVWASSLLARLLKVIIEFLSSGSPPCLPNRQREGRSEGEVEGGSGREVERKRMLASCHALSY